MPSVSEDSTNRARARVAQTHQLAFAADKELLELLDGILALEKPFNAALDSGDQTRITAVRVCL
jgi:hypothetical protein